MQTGSGGGESALPTATPRVYEVRKGDTLFSIAATNGLTLAQLQAANPNVNPLLLSPGTQLVIPSVDGTGVPQIPTPTPVPVEFADVDCYGTAIGELYCFLLVTNDSASAIENVTGIVELIDAQGEIVAAAPAVPPINRVGGGESMPLVAYFAEQPTDWDIERGQVLSAYEVRADDTYYLQADIVDDSVDISDSGLAALATGEVQIAGGETPSVVWVLAVAYDENGKVVGVRRWEANGDNEFALWVYSLGPEISEVQLLVEARR
jgi:LysM repeat protein